MLRAVRPVVVGLLIWTAYDLGKTVFNTGELGLQNALVQGWDKVLIALVAFVLLTFTRINPVFIILSAAILDFWCIAERFGRSYGIGAVFGGVGDCIPQRLQSREGMRNRHEYKSYE